LEMCAATALNEAMNPCQPDVAGRMATALLFGADPTKNDFAGDGSRTRPLEWAVKNRMVDCVAMLLLAGADPDARGPFGARDMTPAKIAAGMAMDAARFPRTPGAQASREIASLFKAGGVEAWAARREWAPSFAEALRVPRLERMKKACG
jgi:hypothetical protein